LLPEDDRQNLDVLEQKIVRMKEEARKKPAAVTSPKNSDARTLSSPKSPIVSPLASPVAASSPAKPSVPEIRQRSASKARKSSLADQVCIPWS